MCFNYGISIFDKYIVISSRDPKPLNSTASLYSWIFTVIYSHAKLENNENKLSKDISPLK
jgi:hypothetical protein